MSFSLVTPRMKTWGFIRSKSPCFLCPLRFPHSPAWDSSKDMVSDVLVWRWCVSPPNSRVNTTWWKSERTRRTKHSPLTVTRQPCLHSFWFLLQMWSVCCMPVTVLRVGETSKDGIETLSHLRKVVLYQGHRCIYSTALTGVWIWWGAGREQRRGPQLRLWRRGVRLTPEEWIRIHQAERWERI